jgi:glycerate kinase
MAGAGAQLLPGFDLVSAWLDLEARLAAADLVITGEGRFDASSLQGKGPGAVAARALARGKRVVVLAGQATLPEPPPGLVARSISPPGLPLAEALREAPQRLTAAVRELS